MDTFYCQNDDCSCTDMGCTKYYLETEEAGMVPFWCDCCIDDQD